MCDNSHKLWKSKSSISLNKLQSLVWLLSPHNQHWLFSLPVQNLFSWAGHNSELHIFNWLLQISSRQTALLHISTPDSAGDQSNLLIPICLYNSQYNCFTSKYWLMLILVLRIAVEWTIIKMQFLLTLVVSKIGSLVWLDLMVS